MDDDVAMDVASETVRLFDAVLFDAGGVLLLPDPTVLGPLLAYHGGDPSIERHVRAHYEGMCMKSRAGHFEGTWDAYNEAYVRSVGVPEAEVAGAAVLLARTRHALLWRWPIADSVTTLRELVARDVPIGVVSNASGQIEEVLRRSRVCQVGDGDHAPMRVIVDSHLVGVTKPDPAIFDHALHVFDGTPRERIAYVGDSAMIDVGAARAAGLHPILLDPYDDHPDVDVRRIRRVSELLDWV
jgi:putative hydrolase of the HAD superfamily